MHNHNLLKSKGTSINDVCFLGHFKAPSSLYDFYFLISDFWTSFMDVLELVSKELNHLAAIMHVYAGGVEFYEVKKKLLLFFKNKMEILLHFLSFL